jgi:hypothetical protein
MVYKDDQAYVQTVTEKRMHYNQAMKLISPTNVLIIWLKIYVLKNRFSFLKEIVKAKSVKNGNDVSYLQFIGQFICDGKNR